MSEEGWGVKQDWEEAQRWYELSVQRGDPVAQPQLADLRLRLAEASDERWRVMGLSFHQRPLSKIQGNLLTR